MDLSQLTSIHTMHDENSTQNKEKFQSILKGKKLTNHPKTQKD